MVAITINAAKKCLSLWATSQIKESGLCVLSGMLSYKPFPFSPTQDSKSERRQERVMLL